MLLPYAEVLILFEPATPKKKIRMYFFSSEDDPEPDDKVAYEVHSTWTFCCIVRVPGPVR